MELEKLEIIIDANAERVERQLSKVMPFVEKWAKNMGVTLDKGTEKAEKSMDVSEGATRMEKQVEQLNKNFQRQMDYMEKNSQRSGVNISKNLSTGFTKARKSVGKDVDAIVNEINAKMGQARAKQADLAFLRAQRQGSVANNDEKGMIKYDNQIARAQAQLTKYQDSARGMARQMKEEFDSIPQSLDNIANKMMQNEGKIDSLKAKLRTMNADYEKAQLPKGSFSSGFTGKEDTAASLKIQEQIMKQSSVMDKLIQDNDSLQRAYSMIEDRAQALVPALSKVNTVLGQQSRQTETAGSGIRRFGRTTEGSRGLISRLAMATARFGTNAQKGLGIAALAASRFGNVFNRTSRNVDKGLARNNKGMFTLGTQMKMMFRTFIFYGLLFKGLQQLSQGLWSALKANTEFSASLNQIKVNLLTAFYPIYEAVLPAINALMRALSHATAIFAGFIAALFGTTYSAAKQGAKGLYESVQAMNESGTAADKNKEKIKQMQRSLMGFDEINNLSVQNDSNDGANTGKQPGVDFSVPDQKIPDWVSGWAAQAKRIWKDFFKPIQDAWDKHGKSVIDAWKYALTEVWELVKSIGRSFMTVWTNGTGEKVVSNILKIVRDIGLIIGNLASQFNKAWNEADVGTRIMQNIFDLINIVLGTIQRMTSATAKWAETLDFSPLLEAINRLLESMKPLVQNVFDGIAWAYENILLPLASFTIQDLLPAYFHLLGGALDFVNGIINGIKPAFAWFWDSFLQPIASWSGGVIVFMLVKLGDALSAIGNWISEHSEGFSKFVTFFIAFAGALKIIGAISSIVSVISSIFTALSAIGGLGGLLSTVGAAIGTVVAALGGPLTLAIAAVIGVGVLLWQNWEAISTKAQEIWTVISDSVAGFISALGGYISDFFNAGMEFMNGLLMGIGEALANIGNWMEENIFNPIVNGFKSLFGIHSPSTVFAEFGAFLIEGLYNGIKDLMAKPVEIITTLWTDMKTSVSDKTSEIWNKSKELWGKTGTAIKSAATSSGKWVSDKWKDISKGTSDTWGKVTKWTSDNWGKAKKSVTDNAKNIWDNTKSRWSDVSKNTKKTWDDFTSKVTDTTRKAKDNASNRINEMKNNLGRRFSETWNSTRSNFDNIYSKISSQASNASSKGSSAFRTMRTNMANSLNGLKNTAQGVFDKIGGWASGLPGKIASGLKNGVQSIKNAASSIGNGMVGIIGKAMNGVIKGINWVLGKVGAGKSKLGEWKIPKYATGTGYHQGGLAMVNDGLGSNYQEAYHLPNGQTGLFPKQRNMVVNLPKGSSVLSGQQTANMMKGMPRYASGVGDWFKEKWQGAKEVASDIWSYAKEPSKLLNAAVSKFVNLSNAVQPGLDMAKGTVATVASGATKWVTDKFNSGYKKHQEEVAAQQQASFGSGAFAPKFRNPPFVQTSDYGNRARLFGKTWHGGMDFAAPTGTPLPAQHPGSVSYAGWASGYGNLVAINVAKGLHTLYGHMNSIGVRLGQSVSAGRQIGTVGSTGNSTGPHVHYELRKGSVFGQSVDPKTYGQATSSGKVSGVRRFAPNVARWQGTVERALGMLGLLNTANVNATLNQIRTESNGNPNAINLWDINARNGIPSKGLLQVIDPTFRAYARSPHNKNIWDPMSNILASMRYATSRYGSLTRAYRGVGYANGGWVTEDGIYRMGEGNKKEMVLPLEKPARAMELIEQALNYMGVDWSNPEISMPSTLEPNTFTQPSRNYADNNGTRYEGGGIQDSMESMVNGIMMAVQMMGGQAQQAPNGDIVINIGGKEFGRFAVKEINDYHRRIGRTELNI